MSKHGEFISISFESKKELIDSKTKRSGQNVDLTLLRKETHMVWKCPEGISFTLKRDNGKNPDTELKRITNGTVTEYYDFDNVYPADPTVPSNYLADCFFVDVISMSYNEQSKCDLSNWIDCYVDDTTYITDIMLPGTHDSAAVSNIGRFNLWGCQNVSVIDQLSSGVRLLDIRLKVSGYEEKTVNKNGKYEKSIEVKFNTCHGSLFSKFGFNTFEPFDAILTVCKDFLRWHPGEFIVMILKIDDWGNYRKYESNIVNYLKSFLTNIDWVLPFRDYQKWQVKQNLIYIDRFSPEGWGKNWSDNKISQFEFAPSVSSKPISVYIQDVYSTNRGDKKLKVEETMLYKGKNKVPEKNMLVINYCSACFAITYNLFKIDINDSVIDLLGKHIKNEQDKVDFGWFLVDFSTDLYDICLEIRRRYRNVDVIQCIVDANKKKHEYYCYYAENVIDKKEL